MFGLGSVGDLGGTGRTGFNPASLFAGGNTGGWYDPSDLSTLWQDSARTTPVTANNDPVGAMDDKSGNANHLLQAIAAERLLYKTAGALRWLESDGVDDSISRAFAFNLPIDRVTAARQITWTAGDRLWDGNTANSGLLYQATASPNVNAFAGTDIALTDELLNTDQVFTERWNGASSRFAINNNSYVNGNPGSVNHGGYWLAKNPGGGNQGNIRFYGSIVIGRALTDAEIAKCRTFLGAKAGLAL